MTILRSEVETTIVWTADDTHATVYSLMPRIWRMCINAGGEEIEKERGIRDGHKAARTFLVPIKAVRIRKARLMSEEAAERARSRGRSLAARKMGLAPKEISGETKGKP